MREKITELQWEATSADAELQPFRADHHFDCHFDRADHDHRKPRCFVIPEYKAERFSPLCMQKKYRLEGMTSACVGLTCTLWGVWVLGVLVPKLT